MKLAVIQTGGKQYVVKQGDTIKIEKLLPTGDKEIKEGSKVSFDDVLLTSEGENVSVGTPFVEGSSVSGMIVEVGRSRKVITAKYKAKVRYRNKKGHRQPFMKVKIEEIK